MLHLTPRRFLPAAGLAVLCCTAPAFSQSIPFSYIELTEQGDYVQTSSATPTIRDSAEFDVNVYGGTAFTVSSAPTVTIGGGSKASSVITLQYNGLFYKVEDPGTAGGAMGYRSLSGPSGVYAHYGAGNYTVSVGGTSVTLAVPTVPNPNVNGPTNGFASLVPNVPALTLTGGSWIGQSYVVNAGAAVSFTSSTFSSNFVSGSSAISIQAFDEGTGQIMTVESTMDHGMTAQSLGGVFGAGVLQGGHTYEITVEFATAFDKIMPNDIGNPFPGAYIFGTFSQATQMQIEVSAVPEVSTYTLWAGVVALLGLGCVRARRLRQPA